MKGKIISRVKPNPINIRLVIKEKKAQPVVNFLWGFSLERLIRVTISLANRVK